MSDRRPKRIQLKRTRGWRIGQAHSVARPTRWGNPYRWEDYRTDYPEADDSQLRAMAVSDFRNGIIERRFVHGDVPPYPSIAEIRKHLRGKDLACWCPLDDACHGSVLLEVANAPRA
jgi:hypothetical protein